MGTPTYYQVNLTLMEKTPGDLFYWCIFLHFFRMQLITIGNAMLKRLIDDFLVNRSKLTWAKAEETDITNATIGSSVLWTTSILYGVTLLGLAGWVGYQELRCEISISMHICVTWHVF